MAKPIGDTSAPLALLLHAFQGDPDPASALRWLMDRNKHLPGGRISSGEVARRMRRRYPDKYETLNDVTVRRWKSGERNMSVGVLVDLADVLLPGLPPLALMIPPDTLRELVPATGPVQQQLEGVNQAA